MSKGPNTEQELFEAEDGWCSWGIINGLALAGVGVAIFLILLQFGSQGYAFIIPGGIIITFLVGVIHQHYLRGQTTASSWITVTVITWIVTIAFLSIYFANKADILPYAGQVPTGGAIFIFCPCSAAVGPVVALIGAFVLKSVK